MRTRLAALVASSSLAVLGVPGPAIADPPPVIADTAAVSDGQPRDARISIPALGIHRLRVIAYRGRTDDGPGTRIQDRGIAASPYGPNGGTGPGGLGNYQVTGHRSTHGAVFRRVPSLRRGDVIRVDAGAWRYVYRVTRTRWVSFRSETSLRKQRAAVPGKPGAVPRKGYLTLSTCATPEDRARGNHWTDRHGNPEHRIDKIGVLVKRVPRPARP